MTTPPKEVSWDIEKEYWGYDTNLEDYRKNALGGIGMSPFDAARHAGIVSNTENHDVMVVFDAVSTHVIPKSTQYKYIETSGTTDYIRKTLDDATAAITTATPLYPSTSAAPAAAPPLPPSFLTSAAAPPPPPPTTAAAAPLITYDTLNAEQKRKVDEYVNSSMRRFPNSDRDALRQRTAQRYFG